MPTIQEMIENSKQKLGAIGGLIGDFARGVGATADIPKTIVAGTQTSYGANIPTVEDTRQKLAESTPSTTELAKDTATGVSRIFNSVNTPTANLGATPPTVAPTVASTTPSPPMNAVSRPEGDPNFFKGGAKFEGNSLASTGTGVGMSDKDLADWKARGDLQNSSYYDGKNPNDDKFTGMMKELMDVSGSSPSAETSNKIKSLRLGIQALAPMTSYGQFGVAGLQTDTTKRGQDITAETSRREQDISAKIHGDQLLLDTFYKTGLLEQGKEELGIKKLQAEAKDLPGYLKMVAAISPKIKNTDPVTGEETESHDVAKGVELLTQAGFATPKGFKAPGASKIPSFDEVRAVAKAKGTKMSEERLRQYYDEKYGKGR